MIDLATLQARIFDRAVYYTSPFYHGGREIVTDGICAVLTPTTRGDDCPERVSSVLCAPPTKKVTRVPLASLRDFAGPPGVPTVEPCPDWARHDAEDEEDGLACFYECQYVPGLGFAHETNSRPFASVPRAEEWASILGIPIDCARLAELLAPWPEGEVAVWVRDSALHVEGDGWRVILKGGDSARINAERKWAPRPASPTASPP